MIPGWQNKLSGEMNLSLFFRGLVIGLSIAAPVGPIGVLCIRRTLAEGRVAGLVSGLGAATADMLFGCVAGFGLTFISSALLAQQFWFQLIGGLFLCYLGVRTLLSRPAEIAETVQGQGASGGVYLDVGFDADQSVDDLCLCGDLRRTGRRSGRL
jgi:threonine/homoserine/homoserine lactone efflux protein